MFVQLKFLTELRKKTQIIKDTTQFRVIESETK